MQVNPDRNSNLVEVIFHIESQKPIAMHKKVIDIIRQIPAGKVATYGQIAALAGFPGRARHVGWILNQTDVPDIPWHRVINSRGTISLPHNGKYQLQKALLINEGIMFSAADSIDLKIYAWQGPPVSD